MPRRIPERWPQAALLVLCLAAVAFLWTGLVAFLRSEERAVLAGASADVADLASVVAEDVGRTLLAIDLALNFARSEYQEDPARFDLAASLARAPRAGGDMPARFALADAQGRIAASVPHVADPSSTALDPQTVRIHSEDPNAGLVLGRPRRDPASGRWSIEVSRRIDGPGGALAGIVAAALDPEALARGFERTGAGPNRIVLLLGRDGRVRAGSPAAEGLLEGVAGELGQPAAMEKLARRGQVAERTRVLADGVERVVGYRALRDLPLIVVVAEPVHEALEPLRHRQTGILCGGAVVTAALLVILALLLREFDARRAKEMALAWANQALAEGEARYRLLADNATDLIARIGLDGTIRYVSPAARQVVGYEPEELLGGHGLDYVHPEDREAVLGHLRALLRAGPQAAPSALLYRGRHKDGSWRWLEVNPTPVFDPVTGRATEFVDVIRDVSARKAVEDELRAKSRLLETTLENMDQGLVMIDADGRVVVCNRRAIDLMGFPADLMATCPDYRDVRHFQAERGEYAQADEDFRRWIDGGELIPERLSYERTRPNGTIVEVRTVPLPCGGVVRTYTDVTARRNAEAAGRESESRYRLLADNASDIIVLRPLGDAPHYVSPACSSMLGYSCEEFLALPPERLIHPDDYPRVMAIQRELSAGRREIRHVHRLRHKDGRWIWVEAAFKLMEDHDAPMVLAALRDVTERQTQAEALKAAKEAAEALLRKAEEASRAKSDFLASMSHEVRTPLNSIIGFTNLVLESGSLDPELRRYVEQVRGAGAALLTIVDDVLDFSKIEAGQVELEPLPFELRAVVENAVSIVRGIASERAIPIEVAIAPDLPEIVVGDVDRLRQILLNLLNNAVKFTPQGCVSLEVSRKSDRLRFCVTDTGIGIAADKLPRLFERFHQVDSSIRRKFGGTGLGLAISKRLVELMGGTIGAQSREGEGSTFWFEVPLPESATPTVSACDGQQLGASRPARILLVEDVDINQELARLILERAGHRVDVAYDGGEALRALREKSYDVVLMDVQMPVMDGIAATEHIRRLPGPAASVPIIAMTANVLPDQIARFRRAGMNDHIGKPFQVQELLAAVARWTSAEPASAPANDSGAGPARSGRVQVS